MYSVSEPRFGGLKGVGRPDWFYQEPVSLELASISTQSKCSKKILLWGWQSNEAVQKIHPIGSSITETKVNDAQTNFEPLNPGFQGFKASLLFKLLLLN